MLPVSGLSLRVREATGADEMVVLEQSLPPVATVVTLATRLLTDQGGATPDWDGLPAADVGAIALTIRQAWLGELISTDTRCPDPGCGERMDIAFEIPAYLAHHRRRTYRGVRPAPDAGWFELGDTRVSFRLPTIGDLRAATTPASAQYLEQAQYPEQAEDPEQGEHPEQSGHAEQGQHLAHGEHPGHPEQGQHLGHGEHPGHPEQTAYPEQAEDPKQEGHPEQWGHPEQLGQGQHLGQGEHPGYPEQTAYPKESGHLEYPERARHPKPAPYPEQSGHLEYPEESGHPEQAARSLTERCVRPAVVTAAVARRVSRAMTALAPPVGGVVTVQCPACGGTAQPWFDPVSYALAELRDAAAGLYEEVHLLASAYHWQEQAILALPRSRRAKYAALIRRDRATA